MRTQQQHRVSPCFRLKIAMAPSLVLILDAREHAQWYSEKTRTQTQSSRLHGCWRLL